MNGQTAMKGAAACLALAAWCSPAQAQADSKAVAALAEVAADEEKRSEHQKKLDNAVKVFDAKTDPDKGVVISDENVVKVDDASRSDRFYAQVGVGASFFDARRDTFLARWSPSLIGGYRWDQWGAFGIVEFDQTYDFSVSTDRLDVVNYGLGVDHVWFVGHLRTSLAAGASTLVSSTEIDEAGTTGWFLDIRPASIRWPLKDTMAIELTPLAFDVIVPEPVGIPLVVYAYTSTLSFEFAP